MSLIVVGSIWGLPMESQLVEIVNSFESASSVGDVAKRGVEFLKKSGGRGQAHNLLCRAMIRAADGGNADMSKLLHVLGQSEALMVTFDNIAHAK